MRYGTMPRDVLPLLSSVRQCTALLSLFRLQLTPWPDSAASEPPLANVTVRSVLCGESCAA